MAAFPRAITPEFIWRTPCETRGPYPFRCYASWTEDGRRRTVRISPSEYHHWLDRHVTYLCRRFDSSGRPLDTTGREEAPDA